MNLFSVAHLGLVSVFAFLFLFLGTFFQLFLERFVLARSQHRDGPGRKGESDYFQVVWDFLKVRKKIGPKVALPFRFRIIFQLWRILPFAFIWILISGQVPEIFREAEIPLLVLLIIISAVTEATLINATEDQSEKYDLKQILLLRIIGASNFIFCILTVVLKTGSFDLLEVSASQAQFPFFTMLSSPSQFFVALSAFFSIFLITASGPVRQEEDISLRGSLHYTFFFVRRLWIFCLISFWAFLFLGGMFGIITKLLFPVKIASALIVFFLLQISFPQSRVADTEAVAIRWLLPVSLLAFIGEMIWIGVIK